VSVFKEEKSTWLRTSQPLVCVCVCVCVFVYCFQVNTVKMLEGTSWPLMIFKFLCH